MYTDDTVIGWGKYKFTALKRIPAKWLCGWHKNSKVHDQLLVAYVGDNFDRLKEREEQEKEVPMVVQTPPALPCNKYQYASEEEAKKHLREIRGKGQQSNSHKLPVRAYQCDKCPFWHLTSKPDNFL